MHWQSLWFRSPAADPSVRGIFLSCCNRREREAIGGHAPVSVDDFDIAFELDPVARVDHFVRRDLQRPGPRGSGRALGALVDDEGQVDVVVRQLGDPGPGRGACSFPRAPGGGLQALPRDLPGDAGACPDLPDRGRVATTTMAAAAISRPNEATERCLI